ncbi:MAG TPA: hypothetical protein VK638_25615 [Edaphobacter sp.]|nr:hypothetical protein [Edaphobacter sp.]
MANNISIFVELAVMAPDVTKIDPDRHLELGVPAWNFRDEALRWPPEPSIAEKNPLPLLLKIYSTEFGSAHAHKGDCEGRDPQSASPG